METGGQGEMERVVGERLKWGEERKKGLVGWKEEGRGLVKRREERKKGKGGNCIDSPRQS